MLSKETDLTLLIINRVEYNYFTDYMWPNQKLQLADGEGFFLMFLENTLQVQLMESLAFFITAQKCCKKRTDLKKES